MFTWRTHPDARKITVNTTPAPSLDDLAAEYTWLVNAAIGEGRTDLAEKLSHEYESASLHVILSEGTPPAQRAS